MAVTITSKSQCEVIIDDMTDTKDVQSPIVIVDKNIMFHAVGINGTFSMGIYLNDDIISCVDEDARVILMFDDSSKLDFLNMMPFNCKGTISFFAFDGSYLVLLEKLKSNAVKKILIESGGFSYRAEIKPELGAEFKNNVNCVFRNM